MTNLEINVTRHHCSGKDVACISLKGIGNNLSRELEPTIKDLHAENIAHYIFDFSEVTSVGSTGIGLLIKLLTEVKGVVIIGTNERFKTACDLVGLWEYVTLADNLEHALKMLLELGG